MRSIHAGRWYLRGQIAALVIAVSVGGGIPALGDSVPQLIAAAEPIKGSGFGQAIYVDEDYLIVGAPEMDEPFNSVAGRVYVFQRNRNDTPDDAQDDSWLEVQSLSPSTPSFYGRFGNSISRSGDYLFVGAPGEDGDESSAGAVYVYRLKNELWTPAGRLVASDPGFIAYFGWSTAAQGDLLLIGAPRGDLRHSNAGAVYGFRFNGDVWVEEFKLTPELADDNFFGVSIAIEDDVLVVGASIEATQSLYEAGAAYVFRRQLSGEWYPEGPLSQAAPRAGNRFGDTVGISEGRIIVAAPLWSSSTVGRAGALFVYEWSGAEWIRVDRLRAPSPADEVNFGADFSLHGDALLVGMPAADANGALQAGWAFLFRRMEGVWTPVKEFRAFHPGTDDFFGSAVCLSAGVVAIGGDFTVDGTPFAGGVWIWPSDGPDSDHDGVPDAYDACVTGPEHPDADHDGVPDMCDVCPHGSDISDTDENGTPDACEPGRCIADVLEGTGAISMFGDFVAIARPSVRAVAIYQRSGGAWTEHQIVTWPGLSSNSEFGASVAASEDWLCVGAPGISKVFLFQQQSNGLWAPTAELAPTLYSPNFGVQLSISGGRLVVAGDAGAEVFSLNGDGWESEGVMQPPNGSAAANLVDIDRDRLAVLFDEIGVFLFRYQAGAWAIETELTPSVTSASIGQSMRLRHETVLLGVTAGAGRVHVFERFGADWSETQVLAASDADLGDRFGAAVDIRDGVVAVGASWDDEWNFRGGAVYLFEHTESGWSQKVKIATPYRNNVFFGRRLGLGAGVLAASADLFNGRVSMIVLGPDTNDNGRPDPCECVADFDDDGVVGLSDLAALLSNYGISTGAVRAQGDADSDGDADLADLAITLHAYGSDCDGA